MAEIDDVRVEVLATLRDGMDSLRKEVLKEIKDGNASIHVKLREMEKTRLRECELRHLPIADRLHRLEDVKSGPKSMRPPPSSSASASSEDDAARKVRTAMLGTFAAILAVLALAIMKVAEVWK